MKDEFLIPVRKDEELNTETLNYYAKYFAPELVKEEVQKMFESNKAYAEIVCWPGWRANKFLGEERFDRNETVRALHVTVYGGYEQFLEAA